MKIIDKKKFIARISEIIVFVAILIITPLAINYATILRGHQAFGGEYLVPILGLLIILVIESIYEDCKKEKSKNENRARN